MSIIDKKKKEYKSNLILDFNLKEIMIGLLLGDGNLQTFSNTGNTWRLRIIQGGENHFEYIKHLRTLFDDWTVMPIRENHEISKTGKIYKKWYFNTLSFEQFAELGNAFYKLDDEKLKWRKVIPIDIKDLISDLSLAYWFMDDGSNKWKNKVLAMRICTESFSELEINMLIAVLKEKFNINANKSFHNNNWRLYIGVENYDKMKELIYPHIIPSMRYKFPV